ncbi:MAG TPA: OadG family protein [Bacteroidales bacterium]|nr:OadG family protein [Bacteroidales bacterium]
MTAFTFISILTLAIDKQAGIIVVLGYLIVFIALIALYLVFRYLLPLFLKVKLYRRAAREGRAIDDSEKQEMSGEVNAAIVTAIYLYYNELHDYESNVITIRKVSKTYSPWNSKIYNMRNLER